MSKTTKKDCFAYAPGRCMALKKRYCDFEECAFYKPRDYENTLQNFILNEKRTKRKEA